LAISATAFYEHIDNRKAGRGGLFKKNPGQAGIAVKLLRTRYSLVKFFNFFPLFSESFAADLAPAGGGFLTGK